MSIQEQAKAELDRINFGDEDTAVMLGILRDFFKQWDSGGAVAVVSQVLARLIAGQPLSPLTGADDEWIDRFAESGQPMWQNIRCSSIFKDGNGRVWDIDASDDAPPIMFPYDPTTKPVRMPVYEVEVPSGALTDEEMDLLS